MILLEIPTRLAQGLIRLYQKTLSPDHGPFRDYFPYRVCKFHPTCSQYGYDAIGKYGFVRGSIMACKRVLRCHPWSLGGHDPVV